MLDIEIDNTSLEKKFVDHLLISDNRRTVLSGRFGTGKSTFLTQIETQDQQSETRKFLFVRIYPVNYSIASNDDVFDLIKYDVIIELLNIFADKINLAPYTFPFLLTAQMFLQDKFSFKNLAASVSSVSTNTSEFAENLGPIGSFLKLGSKLNKPVISLIEEYKKFKKSVEENKVASQIEKFFETQELENSLYMMDEMSFVVKDLLTSCQNSVQDQTLTTVLVIDDMDRLDPEHTFRLFNIFSAHHDVKSDKNKFGFDKVLFVCDLDNVREIFHHRYGANVDFNGYVDKFYSLDPFYFDNRKYISEQISRIILSLPVNRNEDVESLKIGNRTTLRSVLHMTCIGLIKEKLLNLRMLIAYPPWSRTSGVIQLGKGYTNHEVRYDFTLFSYILLGFYGSWPELIRRLSILVKYDARDQLNVLNPKLDYAIFCQMVADMCFNFVIDYDARALSEQNGAKVIEAVDGSTKFEFIGDITEPKSVKYLIDFQPFSLILLAIRRSLDRDILN